MGETGEEMNWRINSKFPQTVSEPQISPIKNIENNKSGYSKTTKFKIPSYWNPDNIISFYLANRDAPRRIGKYDSKYRTAYYHKNKRS